MVRWLRVKGGGGGDAGPSGRSAGRSGLGAATGGVVVTTAGGSRVLQPDVAAAPSEPHGDGGSGGRECTSATGCGGNAVGVNRTAAGGIGGGGAAASQ